jgi:3-(3-hydroxy-phenyl)propionate hydroxylase
VQAEYVVGCDGGRSTLRKLLGIGMAGSSMAEPWVVLDTRNDPHTLRYAMHHGDPRRPHVIVPGRDGLCRYEFLLLPGEAPEAMLRLDSLQRLVAPYRTLEAADVVRAKVYTFHALVAERWRVGRALIAGDAAHMMPPFAGQGLNSGLRDAHNLGWKLALLLHGLAGPRLLDTYQQERRAHAIATIALSVRLGRIVMTRSRARALVRDAFFRTLGQVGPVKRYVSEMRYKPAPRFRQPGLRIGASAAAHLVGTLLPQPPVLCLDGKTRLLDDALGTGFALLGPARPGREDPFAALRHPIWDRLHMARVAVSAQERWPAAPANGLCSVVDADARLVPELWPRPSDAATILLVRPDRYVAGAFTPATEWSCGEELVAQLGVPGPDPDRLLQTLPREVSQAPRSPA